MQFTQILLVAAVAVGAYAAPGNGYGSSPQPTPSVSLTNENNNGGCSSNQQPKCCDSVTSGLIAVSALQCVSIPILGSNSQCNTQTVCCSQQEGSGQQCNDSNGNPIDNIIHLDDLLNL